MPKPPTVGSSRRPRNALLLIHDDDDARSAGHRGSRPLVGTGGWRATTRDHFGGPGRGREGSPSRGHAVARSLPPPPPRRNPLAPSSPAAPRAGAREPEVIELGDDDDDDDGYQVRNERRGKAPVEVRRLVKAEPLSEPEDSRARGRGRGTAAASTRGGSRTAGKRKRESPVGRTNPHEAGGSAGPGRSVKQRNPKGRGKVGRPRLHHYSDESDGAPRKKVKRSGRGRHGHMGGDSGPHDAAPARQIGASRSRSPNGGPRKVSSPAKSPVASDGSEDDDESDGAPRKKVEGAERRSRGHKGGDSGRHDAAPSRQIGASGTRSPNGDPRQVSSPAKSPVGSDGSGDDDESDGTPAKVDSAERRSRGHKGGGSSRHDAAPARQIGASRSRSLNSDRRQVSSPVGSDGSGDDDQSDCTPAKVESAGRRSRDHEAGDRGRHDAAPARQIGAASRTCSRNGDRRQLSSPVGSDGSGDDDESDGTPAKVESAERRSSGSGWRGSAPSRQVGAGVSPRTRSQNGDRRKVSFAKEYSAPLVSADRENDDEMEEVRSDDNGEPRDKEENEEEQDAMKGKDDNGDSEDMYKSVEEGENEKDDNGDSCYAAVEEEDTDDTTEPEEEEGGEEESHEAGEEVPVPGTPSGNANADGRNSRQGGGTPPVRKRKFEGLCLVANADTSAGEGVRKRTRLQRSCSDKKLLTRGTASKPYCIDISDSEPEEEVPPPPQTENAQASDWGLEDGSAGDDRVRAPAMNRRRRLQIFDSDESDSEDSSDDSESESDRRFARNAQKKGPSSGRPTNGRAPYRQQQTAKEGCRDYAGCSNPNPRRVKNYYPANARNPAGRGNLQHDDDVSFKKNTLLPRKGKLGAPSAAKNAYDELFDSIFDQVAKHPNGSAPAQEQAPEEDWDTQPLIFSFGDEDKVEVEKSEHEKFMDELWADMDLGLEIIYAEKAKENNGQEINSNRENLCEDGKEHDLIHDDRIGIYCRKCGFVQTEIQNIMPPMGYWSEERDPRGDRELNRLVDRDIKEFNGLLTSMGYEEECSIDRNRSGPVWDLIPGVKEDMFPHQREAFEFMWTKLAGGIDIEQVKDNVKNDNLSGCLVSHAPGTGKTRLAISFIQSYLELFPNCSPMIIAPKVMLATWENEFRKWNVKVPFHILSSAHMNWNGDKTIERKAAQDEEFAEKLSMNNFNKRYMNLLKLQSWVEGSSVIGLSYNMFTRLAKGQGKDGNISPLLLQRPDLLILDEGHTPRNSESNIWKLLVEVRTKKRIILSGTPFQNNFQELYNMLCLLQGTDHVDCKLPGNDEGKGFWTSLTLNNVTDDRFKEIQAKLDPFVHIYNGDILQKSLPGLRESVVILNPLPRQREIIAMMENSEKNGNFDLEYKVSLASIHPSLVTCMGKLSDEVTSILDKPSLERLRLNPSEGVKARFVYEIVRRCHSKERVLVFSQYLEPLDLIREQLSTKFNWTDKEILHMSGKFISEKTRQSMIMAFNDMNSDAKVMLATTKACGEGIQLIGASRVVLLDVVWNPSVGKQAIGRAYRIGQQKIVYTYNLIAEGSQEKSKYDRQAKKDHMSKKLLSSKSAQCNQNDSILEDMTEDENLKEMFMKILPSHDYQT